MEEVKLINLFHNECTGIGQIFIHHSLPFHPFPLLACWLLSLLLLLFGLFGWISWIEKFLCYFSLFLENSSV